MATFWCPKDNDYTIEIIHSVEVDSIDSLSKDEMIQTVACPACGFKGLALYSEPLGASFENDSPNHDAYALDDESYAAADELLGKAEEGDERAQKSLQLLHDTRFADGQIRIQWKTIFPMQLPPIK